MHCTEEQKAKDTNSGSLLVQDMSLSLPVHQQAYVYGDNSEATASIERKPDYNIEGA